jgi:primase-polymerase (primpol)-like protein
MDAHFKRWFPHLTDVNQKKASEPDPLYNCIAWAFKDNTRHWWPNAKRSYWPVNIGSSISTMDAFENWFSADGWEKIPNKDSEKGYEKIALYALNGSPTHAARLLDSGKWTSKLGASIDLLHDLTDLEGPEYGSVIAIYRKRI